MNEEFTPGAPPNKNSTVEKASEQPTPLKQENAPELTLVSTNSHPEGADSTVSIQHPDLNISRYLKAPRLANVKPNTVSYEQANAGVHINIPGSEKMRLGDTLVFYWGQNKSSTLIRLRSISKDSTVRVLCVSYDLIAQVQYGLVDVYYEVHRDQYLIGTSPAVRVTVNRDPAPARQRPKRSNGPGSSTANA
jgi:hypothetical protein